MYDLPIAKDVFIRPLLSSDCILSAACSKQKGGLVIKEYESLNAPQVICNLQCFFALEII